LQIPSQHMSVNLFVYGCPYTLYKYIGILFTKPRFKKDGGLTLTKNEIFREGIFAAARISIS
jgi:hypothetical protein